MSDVLSVVIPAHNEADSIPTALRGVYAALTAAGVEHEIVVVDDHCSDGTGDVVRALAESEIPTVRARADSASPCAVALRTSRVTPLP